MMPRSSVIFVVLRWTSPGEEPRLGLQIQVRGKNKNGARRRYSNSKEIIRAQLQSVDSRLSRDTSFVKLGPTLIISD